MFYERRPSLWVEPKADWGKGTIQLVELPTDDETFDNIVAFWKPADKPRAGEELLFSYRLHWGAKPPVQAAARARGRHAHRHRRRGRAEARSTFRGASRSTSRAATSRSLGDETQMAAGDHHVARYGGDYIRAAAEVASTATARCST